MTMLKFIESKENDFFVYKYIQPPIDSFKIFEDNWNGLSTHSNEPMQLFGIYSCIEDNIIYTTLIWELLKSYNIYCLPQFYRDQVNNLLKTDFEFVKWEYSIDYEFKLTEPIEKGFTRSRVSRQFQKNTSICQSKYQNSGGLFLLNSYQDVVNALVGTFGDATSELNFFATEKTKHKSIAKSLNSFFKPKLEQIINDNDIFIDLLLGFDDGYYSCILIKSKRKLFDELNQLTDLLNQKINSYARNLPNIKSLDDFLLEMKKINTL